MPETLNSRDFGLYEGWRLAKLGPPPPRPLEVGNQGQEAANRLGDGLKGLADAAP